jgi:hypothetical protein
MTPFHHIPTGFLCLLLTLTGTPTASAHGLEENRATLVLRDQNHVSATLYITFSEALHRALSPELSFQEFVLAYAAMPPEVFEAALLKAQSQFEAEIRAETSDGRRLFFKRWTWPAAVAVQQTLRERAMRAIAAPNEHAYETALEVRAELQATKAIESVRVSFPLAFQRVLVVSYKPNQVWVEPQRASSAIKF